MRTDNRTQIGWVLGMVTLLLAVTNTIHAADWLPGYQGTGSRQLLSVTNRAHLSANLANFPVSVRLTPRNYTDTSLGGSDVRFTAGDGTTLLDFERETHDALKAIWVYWVRLPAVYAASNTDFYVYYRPTTNTDLSSGTNVWAGSAYRMVQHVEETSGTTLSDSTANARNLGLGSRTLGTTGQIGNGAGGTGAAGDRDDAAMLAGSFTYSAWIKPAGYSTSLAYGDIPGTSDTYYMSLDANGKVAERHHTGAAYASLTGATTVPLNAWTHVAHVLGGGAMPCTSTASWMHRVGPLASGTPLEVVA